MTGLEIHLDGDGCWPDLAEKQAAGKLHEPGRLAGVALLPSATTAGKHTVTFRVELPDGSIATAETTLALLVTAVGGLKTRAEMQGQSFE